MPEERNRLAALGADATAAVEGALRGWRPGATDRDVMGGVAARCERAGIVPVCLIVGGDDRLERFRHPLADGSPMHRQAMAVLVGMRHGLHVALTRHVSVGPPGATLAAAQAEALQIEAAVLDACAETGVTYGDVLARLADAYGDGRWQEHWQGGPIGYRQREFEIAPAPPATRWHDRAGRRAPRDRLQPERRRRRQGGGHLPRRRRPPGTHHREHHLAGRRDRRPHPPRNPGDLMPTDPSPSSGLRSARWFAAHDLPGFLHRASVKAIGVSRTALDGRPVIGICNPWTRSSTATSTSAASPRRSSAACSPPAACRSSSPYRRWARTCRSRPRCCSAT